MSSLSFEATTTENKGETKMSESRKTTQNQKQCNNNNNNVVKYDDSQFPDGMRVLLVDENPVCLKIITTLLHKCRYQVTAMDNSAKALSLLKQEEDKFDIVLTNVQNSGEIDGFKLLEAGLELDIPVIMISASEDVEIVKKGVMHGARQFLLKPVCLSEIKNIWQHVYRKNFHKSPNNNVDDGNQENNNNNKGDKMRKRSNNSHEMDDNDNDNVQPSEERKRLKWTQPLHAKFVAAVVQLGGVDKAVPTKIMELMQEDEITREKVASHLQKYRKSIKNNFGVDQNGHKRRSKKETNTNTASVGVGQSIPVSSHIGSDQGRIMGPMVSRCHVPNAGAYSGPRSAAIGYPQPNAFWMVNPVNQPQPLDIIRPMMNQPQPLDIRPSQVMMQQPGIANFVQGNHHLQQHPILNGDFRSLCSDSFDFAAKQVSDEFDNWPLVMDPPYDAVSVNGCTTFDEEYQNFLRMNS